MSPNCFDQAMKTLNSRPAAGGRLRPVAALLLAGLVLGLGAPRALAQATPRPPERMTYQGFLVDGNGVALGNTAPKNYDIIFRIYNHETATASGNLLWGEQQTVTVDKGYFSVLLGEGAAVAGIPNAGITLSSLFKGATASDRYVAITVKGIGANGADVDIVPRLRLLSSPYAFLAHQSTKLVQENGTDLISASGNAVTVGGPVTATSFTGSGSGITGLNAGNITTGTLSADRLPSSVARRDAENTFSGNQTTSGHLRVGLVENSAVTSAGYGKALILSGAPRLGNNWNNDNSDPLWLARYNAAENQTQLRINLGDDPGSAADRLVIGTTSLGGADFNQTGTWTPLFQIDARGSIEFRPDLTKEANAGKVGYELFTAGALDIVGAGTTSSNRKIKFWTEGGATFTGGANFAGVVANTGGFLARGGYPGGNGINNNGYAFSGNSGDNDSGMFSDADGYVRFTSNSELKLSVYPSGVFVHGGLFCNGMPFGDYRNVQWNDSSGRFGYDNSSRRFKENITPLKDDFERLLQMEPRTYTRPGNPDRWEIGYIAEEFHDAGLTRLVEYDKEGQPDGINYEKICIYLNEIVKRQQSELEVLRSRVASHESRVASQDKEMEELKGRLTAMEKLFRETVAALGEASEGPSRLAAQTRSVEGR
jgi:hypothetical protein